MLPQIHSRGLIRGQCATAALTKFVAGTMLGGRPGKLGSADEVHVRVSYMLPRKTVMLCCCRGSGEPGSAGTAAVTLMTGEAKYPISHFGLKPRKMQRIRTWHS